MKYPNLRYGNRLEFSHYAQNVPLPELARRLRRSERSVRDWMTGAARVPWWVPELLRLQRMEHLDRLRQMNMHPGPQRAAVIPLTVAPAKIPAGATPAPCDTNQLRQA